ncbi:Cytochrome c biogenesis protein Ccs1 [compost metagenome]
MVHKKTWYRRILKALSSFGLAVIVISGIGIITAIGTIVEAKYDAYAAKKLVYETPWMFGIMGLLCINLIAVMVDRLPWKKRHVAFVFAHIGILILLFGGWLTMKYGLDGNMRVGIGESNSFVQVPETDIVVYASFDGDRYTKSFEKEVDFFRRPPTAEKPFLVPAYGEGIKVIEYVKYAMPSKKVIPAETGKAGAGLRFQVQNPNVNVIEWVVQKKVGALTTHNFGPAQVHLGVAPPHGQGNNEIYLTPEKDGLKYVIFHKDSQMAFKRGFVKEGEVFEPGWMGIQFRVLRYLPAAREDWDIQVMDYPTPLTTSAVKIVFEGKEHWVLLNDMVKLFTNDAVYLMTYGNRRIDLGFPLKLLSFEVDRYQGTMRAAAYKSMVEVPNLPPHEISMNEPLKYRGLTIYQASFTEDNGRPTASIFSVNQDPGRFWKYLGSLVMTLGIILLFYFKHLDFKLTKKTGKPQKWGL